MTDERLITVRAPDAITARQEAERQNGGRPVHISSVFFVSDPTMRDWTFSTVLRLP